MSDEVVNQVTKNNPKDSALNKEKIHQLLLALGSKGLKQSPNIECEEYNWNRPHPFSTTQLKKLNDFEKRVAQIIGKKFGGMFNADFLAKVTSGTQHFAGEIITQVFTSEKDDYFLAFGTDPHEPFGFVKISIDTAVTWITKLLLGDPESENEQEGDLSQLEESLLFDLASCIVNAISAAVPEYHYQTAENIIRARIPLKLQGTEEMCDIKFSFEKTDPQNPDNSENMGEAHIFVFCDKLEPVVGKSEQAQGKFTKKDIPEALVKSLKKMRVSVSAHLGSSVLTFDQLMDLQVGDILLCDKRIDEPIELKILGRTVFYGWPAKTAGKYALVIKNKSMSTQASLVAKNNP